MCKKNLGNCYDLPLCQFVYMQKMTKNTIVIFIKEAISIEKLGYFDVLVHVYLKICLVEYTEKSALLHCLPASQHCLLIICNLKTTAVNCSTAGKCTI